MRCGLRRVRTVQLHPTRTCNLSCRHCYSSSGPGYSGALEQDLVINLLRDLAALGYGAVSISGGKPLLWPGLVDTLKEARRLGLLTALTTNAMPLNARLAEALAPVVDVVAVSLAGAPERHDRVRGKSGAFATMSRRLPLLRAAGIPFGFIFTLTRNSLDDIAWVAGFAIDAGATLLQIHPLDSGVGRAVESIAEEEPDDLVASGAYLAALRLRDLVEGRLDVHIDAAHRETLREAPELVLGGGDPPDDAPPAAFAPDLVVEADGTVVPLQHGFPREYALGSLREAPLPELVANWRARAGDAQLRAHLRRSLERILAVPDALPAVDWYRATMRHS